MVGWIGYMAFFYEEPRAKQYRESCEAKGGKIVKRPNAIQIDILPYPLANYHRACQLSKGGLPL